MAANKTESEKNNLELKHLGFVRTAAIQTLVCISNLYDYAKHNSGPLRSTVGTVEGAVTSAVGPVYEKVKDVPDDLLVFFDKKVDKATDEFEKHAPSLAKQAVNGAQNFIQKATQTAEKLVNEARTGGPRAAIHFAATEYKQLILNLSVKSWIVLNHYPHFHKLADLAVPAAAHWSEKYNSVVKDMGRKGYSVFAILPLVPVDEIAKVFKKQDEAGKKGEYASADSAERKYESDSDSNSD